MREYENSAPKWRNPATVIWALACTVLIGPSLLVWLVRSIAYAQACAPGPKLCHGLALGYALRDALNLAWALPTNTLLLVTVAVAATIAGLFARRPLMSAALLLILPVASLVLPMVAVASARYDGCQVSESGVGDCALWGANMGMSFHTAAQVPALIFGFFPYTAALALMLGLLGLFFSRQKPSRSRTMAQMSRTDRP